MIKKLLLTWQLVQRLDVLEAIASKMEALQGVVERVSSIEKHLPDEKTIETMLSKLEHLDAAVAKIEGLGQPLAVSPAPPGAPVRIQEHLHEWGRLKLLAEFVTLSSHAEEIEKEWQRIQQDEHDFKYAFNTSNNEDTQLAYIYRKGLADGIKWVKSLKDRFS